MKTLMTYLLTISILHSASENEEKKSYRDCRDAPLILKKRQSNEDN
jgi:hypothetical protein